MRSIVRNIQKLRSDACHQQVLRMPHGILTDYVPVTDSYLCKILLYKNYEDTYNTTYMMNAWQTTGIGIY